ncbi:unnamed protein product [Dicrocoelium dendriticum]|nr:unnamed protein product [Dicrocoelium dendriticum]
MQPFPFHFEADLSIIIMDASKIQERLETKHAIETVNKVCSEELAAVTTIERFIQPNLQFWSYDRFNARLYCVLDTKRMVTGKYEFFKSESGTIILSPFKKEMFSSDISVNTGSVRFVVVLPSWEEDENGFKNEVKRVLPNSEINVLMEQERSSYGKYRFTIDLKEHGYAPWGYPDFQMEALNKLEHLVELPFMREAKVEEIKWYSQEGMRFYGIYFDAYYKINRTISNGTCEEFLNTLQQNIPYTIACRKTGEEKSLRFAERSVVKLELYFDMHSWSKDNDARIHLTVATKLRTSQRKCLYPVRIRPKTSFYEPSKCDEPHVGYSFDVYLRRKLKYENQFVDACKAIEEQLTLPIANCTIITSKTPRHVQIVTGEINDGVLNVLTQLMEELNDENKPSCTSNVALRKISKEIPQQ